MISFANVRALLGLHPAMLLIAACGGSVAPQLIPGDPGSGGSAAGTEVPGTTAGGTGGSAGSSVAGAGGNTSTTVPTCVPGQSIACACNTGESGAQVCLGNGTYAPCVCSGDAATWEQKQLARLRNGIVGTWTGMQTNKWNSGCSTTIAFEAGEHYSAHSPGDECIVFYYGSNDDSPQKTYLLDDVLPTGEGIGEINFWFGPDNTNRGQLRHLNLSADESELSFEAWKEEYGPLLFTLKRVGR